MSTDRELLALAAKAAGLELVLWKPDGTPHASWPADTVSWTWNPLAKDGDAAHLECHFGFDVMWFPGHIYIGGAMASARQCACTEYFHNHNQPDGIQKRKSAKRRAIVRAAALLAGG